MEVSRGKSFVFLGISRGFQEFVNCFWELTTLRECVGHRVRPWSAFGVPRHPAPSYFRHRANTPTQSLSLWFLIQTRNVKTHPCLVVIITKIIMIPHHPFVLVWEIKSLQQCMFFLLQTPVIAYCWLLDRVKISRSWYLPVFFWCIVAYYRPSHWILNYTKSFTMFGYISQSWGPGDIQSYVSWQIGFRRHDIYVSAQQPDLVRSSQPTNMIRKHLQNWDNFEGFLLIHFLQKYQLRQTLASDWFGLYYGL